MQFLAGTDILAELANYCIKLLIWQERTHLLMRSFQGKMHRSKTVLSSGLLLSKRKVHLAYSVLTDIITVHHVTERQSAIAGRGKEEAFEIHGRTTSLRKNARQLYVRPCWAALMQLQNIM